jgi:UDP-N-acetylglucosamine--N-acetylmuramyl-(pentapeptide) pyrophosphoryl-undecaprenol N-acetylglucosamine transferase
MTNPLFLIAAGGTGGHIFPGLAVADALQQIADVDIVFVGTPRGLEKDLIPARGYRLELMRSSPIKGGGVPRAVTGAAIAAFATLRSFALVRRLAPRVVLTVGGYSAGPVSLAAAALGVPVALLEPNSTPGLSNRLVAPFSRRAYVAFEETAKRFGHRARILGVPLRPGFVPRPYAPRTPPRVLVMGGSQGASALNERVPAALRGMDVDVIHQCGSKDIEAVRRAYEGTRATVISFLDDVPGALDRADLVIARASAMAFLSW